MPDAAETALETLSGWVDVTVNAAIKKDEMLITRVFYEGAPAFIRCVGGEMTMSVINQRDFWAVDLGALEGHGG